MSVVLGSPSSGVKQAACLSLALFALVGGGTAQAACGNTAPANGETVTCSGANTAGVIAPASTGVTVTVAPNGSIIPSSGLAISLGGGATVGIGAGADPTIDTSGQAAQTAYAIVIGDGSTVTIDGIIKGKGGISDANLGTNLTGFAGSTITLDASGKIITSGTVRNYALNGRSGGNIYQIDGMIDVTGASGAGIGAGDGDQITIGATGSIITRAGDSSEAISGSGKSNVKVTVAQGGLVETHGLGYGVWLGNGADVKVEGTIKSLGDAAGVNSGGGAAISAGNNARITVAATGRIYTGNPSGTQGSSAWGIIAKDNATIQMDGLIDTQRAHGIDILGKAADITIGRTGTVTVHGGASNAYGIFVRANAAAGDAPVNIVVAGRVENLGAGAAIYLMGDNGPVDLVANVTIAEGGSLFAQNNVVYKQADSGGGNYPAVIDNLVIAGKIERGSSGIAIDLNDGDDVMTLLPTYEIIGGVTGGNGSDRFQLDGAIGTTGTFDFDAVAVTNFESGRKQGAGDWILKGIVGANAIAGTFEVQQGLLSVDGTMLFTDFDIKSGGMLGGNGSIRSLGAAGIVNPGSRGGIGTLTAGSASFTSGSVFQVDLDPSDADLLTVTGTATIDAGAQVSVLAGAGSYADGMEYLILDATIRAGAFGGVIDNSAFLSFMLDQDKDPNQVWLRVAQVAVFPDVAETPNQLSTAQALQTLDPANPIYDAVLQLGAGEARQAFDRLSGEIHASLKSVIFEESRYLREAVFGRLNQAASGDLAITPVADADLGAASRVRSGLWGRGFGSWGELDGNGNAASVDRSAGGFFAGLDGEIAEDMRFGLIAGYGRTSLDADRRAATGDLDGYHIGVYGGMALDSLNLRLGAAYGWYDIDTRRQADFPGFSDRLDADYSAETAQVFGELGYRFDLGGLAAEPFARAAHVHLHTGGLDEEGGAAALSADSDNQDMTFTTLGLRAAARFSLGRSSVTAQGLLGWRHGFGDITPETMLALAGSADFAIAGVPVARDALLMEAGLAAKLGEDVMFGLSYSGQTGDGVEDHGVRGSIAFTW
ncbi:MAG: autotransporter outer membrane beta-barrel domain-containing protein [Pseudomonadota bacterium]